MSSSVRTFRLSAFLAVAVHLLAASRHGRKSRSLPGVGLVAAADAAAFRAHSVPLSSFKRTTRRRRPPPPLLLLQLLSPMIADDPHEASCCGGSRSLSRRRGQLGSGASPSTTALASAPSKNAIPLSAKEMALAGGVLVDSTRLHVREEIGSGSYGTVHRLVLLPGDGDEDDGNDDDDIKAKAAVTEFVGKRAWDRNDLSRLLQSSPGKTRMEPDDDNDDPVNTNGIVNAFSTGSTTKKVDDSYLKDREERCRVYFDAEVHCFAKLPPHPCLPTFYGVHRDASMVPVPAVSSPSLFGRRKDGGTDRRGGWMLFEPIKDSSGALAKSLQAWINREQRDRKQESRGDDGDDDGELLLPAAMSGLGPFPRDPAHPFRHHLSCLSIALGFSAGASLTAVLDAIMRDVLTGLAHLHSHGIVHRDVKPGNLLVVDPSSRNGRWGGDPAAASPSAATTTTTTNSSRLVLIDFGSAADLTTFGMLKKNVGISERVAVSPVYSAPEVFVDASCPSEACTFDCFSAGLLFCQLLFQLYDERSDAGFRQQLHASNYDLNAWLQAELQSKVTPAGLEQALEVLQDRPGLWNLLQQLLQRQPRRRISSADALRDLDKIQNLQVTDPLADGAFLRDVLESMETCDVEDLLDDAVFASLSSSFSTTRPAASRLLHYVATFDRSQPLGLILSEASGSADDEIGEDDDEMSASDRQQWEKATANARPGEVFVKGVVEGGQAEKMGIFEVGDRLQGVGELPVGRGGFEKAVAMIQDQPRSSQYVSLQFDRRSNFPVHFDTPFGPSNDASSVPVVDQGAWSSQGQRQAQEDTFVLNLIQDDARRRTIVLGGVCDGHLGRAASSFVRDRLPDAFSQELAMNADAIEGALEAAWSQVCDDYTFECRQESCAAEYDPREGVLLANTGSADDVAGTTATLLAVDMQSSSLALLNCGDSRAVVVRADSSVIFQTADHSPGDELERFIRGRELGLNYTTPMCVLSRWVVHVGDYTYGVSRSLEGTYATSKGIISTPDVTQVTTERGMSVVLATDGLWEVIDSEEVGRILRHVRYNQGMSAADAAKTLCSLAIEKGSKDNVSVVVVYLEA